MGVLDDPGLTDADRIYIERAQATATVPLIFLNSNALDRAYYDNSQTKTINPADLDRIREMMDSQIAGISRRYPAEGIERIAGLSMDGRHFSMQQDIPAGEFRPGCEPFRYAFINMPRHGVAPTEMESLLFQSSPQAEYYWSGFWGGHEGNHAGFEHLSHGHTLNIENPGENEVLAINAELSADREGLEWLRSQGQEEVAQAVIDYRALHAFSDRSHAALAILADEPGTQATVEHFRAATEFQGVMTSVVERDLGLSQNGALELERLHPGAFHNHLRRLIDEGAFDNASQNPYVREFIVAYAGAYERQITNRRPDPEAGIDLRTDRTIIDALPTSQAARGIPLPVIGGTSDPGKEPPGAAPPAAEDSGNTGGMRPLQAIPSTLPRP